MNRVLKLNENLSFTEERQEVPLTLLSNSRASLCEDSAVPEFGVQERQEKNLVMMVLFYRGGILL